MARKKIVFSKNITGKIGDITHNLVEGMEPICLHNQQMVRCQ
jgi:hypothetical protein